MGTSPPLSQGVGYGVVLGLGFAFAFGMIVSYLCLRRFNWILLTFLKGYDMGAQEVGVILSSTVMTFLDPCLNRNSVVEGPQRCKFNPIETGTDAGHRYQNEVQTSEMFSTAGRTVKSGLVAAAVVSSW